MNVGEIINNIYKKNGYLARYGGSLILAVAIISTFSLYFTYQYLLTHKGRYQKNWANERCNPLIMPFAGVIMDPPNMSKTTFAILNFTNCTQNILADIVSIAMMPLQFGIALASASMSIIIGAMDSLRNVLASLRFNSAESSKTAGKKQVNAFTSFAEIFIRVKDMFRRAQAMLISGLYTLVTIFRTLIATIQSTITLEINILLIMFGVLVGLWLIWYGLIIPAAYAIVWLMPWLTAILLNVAKILLYVVVIPYTIFYVVVSILLAIVAGISGTIMRLAGFTYKYPIKKIK